MHSFHSICVKEVDAPVSTKSHILPIYPTSSFVFENIEQGIDIFTGKEQGHVYSRYGNPTVEAVAAKLAALEVYGSDIEANGIMVSSGMSAISTLFMATLKAGDKVLSQGNLYGGTTELLQKIFKNLGVEPIFTNLRDLNQTERLLKENPSIKMLYFETPANPTLACVNIQALSALGKKYGAWTAIDNTFPTPYFQQPLILGCDFVIHSTTKFLNGHGNSIAGVIIGKDLAFMQEKVWTAMKLAGTNCNPWDAWLTHNGLKTLTLRMDRHQANATALANYLKDHNQVAQVNYLSLTDHPDHLLAKQQMSGFGGMMSFELKGGLEAGIKFMSSLKFCTLAPTLGDTDTLILHPASMSHKNVEQAMRERNGITDGLIRVSVGIESVEDIIADMDQAISSIQ